VPRRVNRSRVQSKPPPRGEFKKKQNGPLPACAGIETRMEAAYLLCASGPPNRSPHLRLARAWMRSAILRSSMEVQGPLWGQLLATDNLRFSEVSSHPLRPT